jgi:hypothetical protein
MSCHDLFGTPCERNVLITGFTICRILLSGPAGSQISVSTLHPVACRYSPNLTLLAACCYSGSPPNSLSQTIALPLLSSLYFIGKTSSSVPATPLFSLYSDTNSNNAQLPHPVHPKSTSTFTFSAPNVSARSSPISTPTIAYHYKSSTD